jgi:hypothetical protein
MKIKIVKLENLLGQLEEHVIIDRGNGEFTSMPKETWDKMQESANLSE